MTVVTSFDTPIQQIQALGQSVWMDTMSRRFAMQGELKALIDEDDLRGCTSNPTIFDEAIRKSSDYDTEIRRLVAEGADADAIYEELTTADIRAALDLFAGTYERTQALDGYVSLEVSPLLARDTDATLAEARKLWKLLDRPNAMIKIPGTPEGLPAIEEALFEGININVTLLFSVAAYEAVAEAYVRALQRRADAGLPLHPIASVASFFVSRIDSEVDSRIAKALDSETNAVKRAHYESLLGKLAIANAKLAYESFQRIFGSDAFAALKAKGAQVQRVLWASVGTKNPKYRDTLYIDELIGPDTVSTMPPETFRAFRDHGNVGVTLTEGAGEARRQVQQLNELGIPFDEVTQTLLEQGIVKFAQSFEHLMKAIADKRASFVN
jgi:transaldolase